MMKLSLLSCLVWLVWLWHGDTVTVWQECVCIDKGRVLSWEGNVEEPWDGLFCLNFKKYFSESFQVFHVHCPWDGNVDELGPGKWGDGRIEKKTSFSLSWCSCQLIRARPPNEIRLGTLNLDSEKRDLHIELGGWISQILTKALKFLTLYVSSPHTCPYLNLKPWKSWGTYKCSNFIHCIDQYPAQMNRGFHLLQSKQSFNSECPGPGE